MEKDFFFLVQTASDLSTTSPFLLKPKCFQTLDLKISHLSLPLHQPCFVLLLSLRIALLVHMSEVTDTESELAHMGDVTDTENELEYRVTLIYHFSATKYIHMKFILLKYNVLILSIDTID